MLSNTTAIAEAWARLDHKFDLHILPSGLLARNRHLLFQQQTVVHGMPFQQR
jgi:adenylosuccinate synthase